MAYDFATPIERRHPEEGFSSQKWHRYPDEVLPLWVADMDFRSPPEVINALEARVAHGVYGYGDVPESLMQTLCEWSATHYDWFIEPVWQHWLPGVVPALHFATLALTQPGDGVLTIAPIYPPFLAVAKRTGRLPQQAMLAMPPVPGEQWQLDIEAIKAAITPQTRLLLWCHPHNPTGRVWQYKELAQLAELIEMHDLWVVSDELHCDLLLDKHAKHQPLAAMFPQLAKRTITLWAPSKTFNLAGLGSACAIIPDVDIRARFIDACKGLLPDVNVLGLVAAEAAYREGEPWRQALLEELRQHRATLNDHVANWGGVGLSGPEATYLAWLDMREAGLGETPYQTIKEQAGVALSDGSAFGCPGFVRLNFGTTASQLNAALIRMDKLLKKT